MTESTENPRWLTVANAARELEISSLSLYRAIREGEFPAMRVGRRIFVPAGALEGLAAEALKRGVLIDAKDWRELLALG
ncbi:hypothetical protein GCM10009554_46610 [Kribbella koreensis]|uniref:Helix-turn-helix domain-containing protein n=1 Tax=Kribbella koreensis TaxID=57909 RepID=A0ABP4BFS9_9ACTN